jgi:hypothetical protein
MTWLPLLGIAHWIDPDLVASIDSRRRNGGELQRVRKLGTLELLNVELCCLFAVLPRIPLAWVVGRANTNERPMLKRLVAKLMG